jgi:hypothetical protein
MWILIMIGIIAVLIVLLGIYVIGRGKQRLNPMQAGMTVGGIAGMVIGIALVELWGYEYPLPFILWLLGMAGGQLSGWLYKRKKLNNART